GFGSNIAGGARTDLDDELLAELFREELSEQAHDDVGGAACRLADDDLHRSRRIGLCACNMRSERQRGSAGSQMQKLSAGKFHGVPSQECRTPISADASTLAHRDYRDARFRPGQCRRWVPEPT